MKIGVGWRAGAFLLAAGLLTACRREDIQVYRVPKEKPMASAAVAPAAHEHSPAAMPRLEWKLPPGWEEREPGRMTVASFSIRGAAEQEAEVSVMPMPGESASNLSLLVNIVREGAGMGPVTDEELARLVEDIRIGDATARLVDLSGATAASGAEQPNRIVLAVLARAGTTWFFKLSGSTALVTSQKGAFLDFLKSITFHTSEQTVAGAESRNSAAGSEARPRWELPPGWQEAPPTQMVLAKFLLPGEGGARAEVSVSVFPGDVGGLLANVNRWRRQIGLAEVGEAEVSELVGPLDAADGKAMLVDMSGPEVKSGSRKRLIGVILPLGGRTWFYKLMGDEAVAEREKPAFMKFVQSAKHPNEAQ